jgi:Beta-propeller repeat
MQVETCTGIGTTGTYQPTYIAGNGIDAFLVKFNNAGARQWSTYFGGGGSDYAYGVACDAGGNIYIGGQTNSATGIASAAVFQSTLSGVQDGFFAKFTTTGALVFASYFGGSGTDGINAITCDATSNFIVTGQTNSINIIAAAVRMMPLSNLSRLRAAATGAPILAVQGPKKAWRSWLMPREMWP